MPYTLYVSHTLAASGCTLFLCLLLELELSEQTNGQLRLTLFGGLDVNFDLFLPAIAAHCGHPCVAERAG